MAETALLIHNPAAGRHRAALIVAELEQLLASSGLAVRSASTEGPEHARELARTAASQGVDIVFSLGGDGTLRECAEGVLGSDTSLGFLPGGTVNVMARALGLSEKPASAARQLLAGVVCEMDVGWCGDRCFLMQASAGIDASILARIDPRRKKWLGRLEVGLGVLAALADYDFPEFTVRFAGRARRATFVAVCNIPFYGGAWRLAPDARWDDGRLDLVLFRGRGRARTLGLARDLLLGRHLGRADVESFSVESVEICPAPRLGLQLDGDALDLGLPTIVRLARHRLRMLVPAAAEQAPSLDIDQQSRQPWPAEAEE